MNNRLIHFQDDSQNVNNHFQVITVDEELVVDSRLVAQELGIEHETFMRTIRKYLSEIQEFGHLRFKNSTVTNSVKARNTVVFCYLNESQATYAMTLSRNTEKVRQCKRNLVKAFSEAKKIISTVIPQQSDRIQELQLELELIKLKTNYMEKRDAIAAIHGTQMLALLDGRPDAVVEKVEKLTETIVINGNRKVSFEGKSTAEVAKEFGFKTGKQLEAWLERIGASDLICQGLRAVQAPYIPTENLSKLKQIFVQYRGKARQMLIGEEHH